jgi:hypothetical protein
MASLTTPMMQADPSLWLDLIYQHLGWYPLMEIADIYKLLYQGVMGPEHMVATQQEFARRLEAEFDSQLQDEAQPVLEVIRPDYQLYRLNLRPYKASHSSVDELIPAMLATTKLITGTLDDVRSVWSDFSHNVEQGKITRISSSLLAEFNNWLTQHAYPPIHHSEVYTREYRPAYRLISSKFIAELGLVDAG